MFGLIQEFSCRLLLCVYRISCAKALDSSNKMLLVLERLDVGTTNLLISFVAKCHLEGRFNILEDCRIVIGPCWQVSLGVASTI